MYSWNVIDTVWKNNNDKTDQEIELLFGKGRRRDSKVCTCVEPINISSKSPVIRDVITITNYILRDTVMTPETKTRLADYHKGMVEHNTNHGLYKCPKCDGCGLNIKSGIHLQ